MGCRSGALTIACARRNPQAHFIGLDRWGKEYASYNKPLCEANAKAEGVGNTEFRQGDALRLDFPDGSFDAVTSNYVYHNIPSHDRQKILLETLRVLKKGGTFALHDIFSKAKYGDMRAFADRLREMGYNDHRIAKSIEDSIDFAAKRQIWQRMILGIIRPMLIAMSIGQNSRAVLLRRKAARRKAFWLFAIL